MSQVTFQQQCITSTINNYFLLDADQGLENCGGSNIRRHLQHTFVSCPVKITTPTIYSVFLRLHP